jgi:gliding motility-associated-like protein
VLFFSYYWEAVIELTRQNMKYLLLYLLLTPLFCLAQPPTAQFTGIPTAVCLGSPVSFINQSVNGGSPITNWGWDFGDGNSSTQTNPSHVYTSPGTYTVTLVVTASNGQADAEVKVNYVTVNPTPTASFTTSTNGCVLPVGVTFNNTSSGGATYAWDFGNGQTSTLQNPAAVNYATAGTYNVSLIVTNSFGCKDTVTQALVVSNFQAGITAPATACVGVPVAINDNSTVGANAWSWTFTGGSPASSSSQNNSVTYATAGTYTISLTAQNTGSGCSGTTSQQITILPSPVPAFTGVPTTGCAPQSVVFTNNSPAGSNFVWTFGDGGTFNGQNPPAHVYAANGSYSVTLSMTGANGCTGTLTQNSYINLTPPSATFTADVVNGCDPLAVQFTSTSSSSNPIVSWVWTFGDGTTFNGQNPPVHNYGVGVYDVSLVITTQSGCVGSDTIAEYIQVGHIDAVNFSIDQSPECAKKSIDFTNLSVINAPHDPNEVTYAWDFGDGGTASTENPSYSYPNDTGYFDVQLIVNFRGCLDTLIQQNAVYIKAPISRFQPAQTLYCNPASFPVNVVVNDQSIIGALPDDADMIWRWGDGTQTNFDDPDFDDANLGTTNHNYSAYGSYTITQVIHNYTTGCEDSTTALIHISQTIASFTISNDSVCENSAMTLLSTSTSTHPFGTYSWDMGNGQSTSGQNPSYSYPNSGTFTITLTATNSVGCADDQTYTPMTALETPVALITASDNAGCAPFLVTFTNGSSVAGNGVPLESFTFGFPDDNTTQNTTNVATAVNHTFNTEGSFSVSLVATDEFGCVSAPATTLISITKPVAAFTVDAVVCDEEVFTANNGSTGSAPLSYEWFTDNNPQSTATNLTTSFNEPSNSASSSTPHGITLITTDVNGCKDTLLTPVTVSTPVAIVDYVLDGASTNANGEFTCPPVFADFTDQSLTLGNIVSWNWVFGDGKTSTLASPNNTYVFPGTYSAGLVITDEYGCTSDTALIDFLTIFGPTATPSWTQDLNGCGQNVVFDIGATTNVTQIVWDLNDGTIVNDSTLFTHVYQDVTTYNPSVSIYDSNNCQVIYPLDPVTIPDNGLNAFFTASLTDVQLGTTINYNDQSTSTQAPIVSWTWDLANTPPFTNTNGNSVSSYYVSPGEQVITLTVVNALGCIDQYQLTITVDDNFSMPNVLTANGDGVNDLFEFPFDIFESFDIVILNRWGNVVQDKANLTGTVFWDGTNNGGEKCSEGVYFYKLNATLLDGTQLEKEGFLQLYTD